MEQLPDDPRQSFLQQVLSPLLGGLSLGAEVGKGYVLGDVSAGTAVELTLTKGGGSFVIWLRGAADETSFFKKTKRFLLGYRGEPPDRQGFEVLDSVHRRIVASEDAFSDELFGRLFQPLA